MNNYILVVDDDEMIRQIVKESLCDMGYEIREASSAKEAAEKILYSRPIMVVMDLIMPGARGWTLANMISIPALVFTGAGKDELSFLKDGTKVLHKPASSGEIKEAVLNCMLPLVA